MSASNSWAEFAAVFRRTRKENGKSQQRAELRFDGLAGCLRTPRGGSSRQTLVVVEDGRVKSRLITAREAARLMGLPDSYRLPKSATGGRPRETTGRPRPSFACRPRLGSAYLFGSAAPTPTVSTAG